MLPRALSVATPYVLLCNPNNPTAEHHPHDVAVDAAKQLKKRGGWLIVDEAFMDVTPAESLAPLAGTAEAPNLIVFRSLGKFFGLAGARVGFVLAAPDILNRLAETIGPWTVSGPAREVARLALLDTAWQTAMREKLTLAGARLLELLQPFGEVKSAQLFATLNSPHTAELHLHLAQRGILTRIFDQQPLLRFGLPGSEPEWQRLSSALSDWKPV
jgi:cobalamin biosynthetic protein CobC